jgi:hypothetical protein
MGDGTKQGGKLIFHFCQILNILIFIEPMLFVDVNLGNSGNKRIVVYEGDTAEALAENFARENGLDGTM